MNEIDYRDGWHSMEEIPPLSGLYLIACEGEHASFVRQAYYETQKGGFLTRPYGGRILEPTYAWTNLPRAPKPSLFEIDKALVQLDIESVIHEVGRED